jgi:hypothetical protein
LFKIPSRKPFFLTFDGGHKNEMPQVIYNPTSKSGYAVYKIQTAHEKLQLMAKSGI